MSNPRKSSLTTFIVLLTFLAILVGALGYMYWVKAETEDTLSMDLLMEYEGGVIEPYQKRLQFPFIPQSIYEIQTGKQLMRVLYKINVNPTYTGSATSTSVTGNVVLLVDGVQKSSTPINYGTYIITGSTALVYDGSLDTATLETWSSAPGRKTLQIKADVNFNAVFPSGTASKSGSATSSVSYEVMAPSGITGLMVTVGNSHMYYPGQ